MQQTPPMHLNMSPTCFERARGRKIGIRGSARNLAGLPLNYCDASPWTPPKLLWKAPLFIRKCSDLIIVTCFNRFTCKFDATNTPDAFKHVPDLFWKGPGPENLVLGLRTKFSKSTLELLWCLALGPTKGAAPFYDVWFGMCLTLLH